MFDNIRIFSKIKEDIYSKIEESIENTDYKYTYEVDPSKELTSKQQYVIISNDKTQYWDETLGWTADINKATKYSHEFQRKCYLPIEGEFIKFEEEKK